jgi:hypothetical protein
MRIRERTDNFIKNISCSLETKGGRKACMLGYPAHLNTTILIEDSQKRLLLKSDRLRLLDESFTVTDNGSLERGGRQLSTVQMQPERWQNIISCRRNHCNVRI